MSVFIIGWIVGVLYDTLFPFWEKFRDEDIKFKPSYLIPTVISALVGGSIYLAQVEVNTGEPFTDFMAGLASGIGIQRLAHSGIKPKKIGKPNLPIAKYSDTT